MNLHAKNVSIILRCLHPSRKRMQLSALNVGVKIYRKPLVFFMLAAMCPIPARVRGRVVVEVVHLVEVHVRREVQKGISEAWFGNEKEKGKSIKDKVRIHDEPIVVEIIR